MAVKPANRFLVSRLRGAATTANALRPLGSEIPVAPLSFASGLITSEFPLVVGGLQVAAAAHRIRKGGLRGKQGLAGLALTGASLAGLWRLHTDAERSGDVLEAALREAYGENYRDRIAEPFSPRPAAAMTTRHVLLPASNVRRRYLAKGDVSYGEAGKRNLLDIWHRADLPADAGAPVLVQIHGGAWVVGEKQGQAHPLMAHLAERGWVCVSINYRLAPRSLWPDQIVDVKRALAWVRANIGRHGGDPGFLAITGGSAGGHLCALAALTPNLPEYQPGFEDADTRVDAAVPFYGVYDFTNRDGTAGKALGPFVAKQLFKSALDDDRERWDMASPMSHVSADAPPFFLLHGTNDTVVPIRQARSFAAMLKAASLQPVVWAEMPRAQHAFDALPSVRTHHTVHAVERFLAIVRSEQGGITPAAAVDAAHEAERAATGGEAPA
jgi:acetyl esterase/lipase